MLSEFFETVVEMVVIISALLLSISIISGAIFGIYFAYKLLAGWLL